MAIEVEGCCASCGFLARFNEDYDGRPPYIYEMPTAQRNDGLQRTIRLDAERAMTLVPRCYIDAADISDEIATGMRLGTPDTLATLEVFHKARDCKKWRSYTPGFSPQEHYEKVRQDELEKRRREFEFNLSERNRLSDEKAERSNWIVVWVLGLFALIEVVVGGISLLQLAYPNGWPWLMNLVGNPPNLPNTSPLDLFTHR